MTQQFLNPKILVLSKINKYIKNAIKINRDWYLKQNAIPRKIPTNTNAVIDFCFLVAKYSEIKIKNIGAASFNTIIDKCAIFGFTAKNNCVKIATFLLNKFFVIKNDVKTTPVQDNREIILPARNGSPKRSPKEIF